MSFARNTIRRRVVGTATGAVLVALLATAGQGAQASPDPKKPQQSSVDKQKSTVDKKISDTQANLDDTSAKLINANNALTATNAKVKTAQTNLTNANTNLTNAQNHLSDMRAQLAIAQADETKNQKDLATNTKQQAKSKVLVGGIARQSYMSGGLGNWELTLNVLSGTGDATSQLSLADVVMRQQSGVLTRLASEQAAGTAADDRLSATRRRISTLTVQASNAETNAKTAQTNATNARNALLTLQKTQRTQRDNLQKQKTAELADLKSQQAESARLAGVIRARNIAAAKAAKRPPQTATQPAKPPAQAAAAGKSSGGGVLAAPMPLGAVVSGFGWRVNPVLGVRLLHEGDDFPYACGTPVYAAGNGTVVQASYDSVGGNHVLIDHGYLGGTNLASYYAHFQSAAVVSAGQKVSRGQLIGYSGTTGRSTGCHMHFGVLANGAYVNPAPWIS
ncbi:peptidoglycan DD-metalloendopeptidase family protein [Flexivirga sp. ID2601S]|uniref:Peptidoglycan DD-metalloendopeptidase family protein n=1 Tax=Flexivirga aerilata TaxID=1656889 RepID=A0A849AH79_9MICO|nr:peptidoglycan DD-metalloendopeptidase family protein [Flexivirga aerilata]NNG39217.1 peptidoglycan DD-metalloendopeptidase family protein [Flexivirga aerilata]